MAPKLKDHFDRRLMERIADELHRGWPELDRGRFVAEALDGLDRLELIQRGWHVAEVMQRHLPAPFPRAARLVAGAFPPPATPPDERDEDAAAHPMESFRYLPHAFWVAKYGLDHFDAAMGPERRGRPGAPPHRRHGALLRGAGEPRAQAAAAADRLRGALREGARRRPSEGLQAHLAGAFPRRGGDRPRPGLAPAADDPNPPSRRAPTGTAGERRRVPARNVPAAPGALGGRAGEAASVKRFVGVPLSARV